MSSILTNTGAMTALQTLNGINKDLAKTQDMISTGKKISSAKGAGQRSPARCASTRKEQG